MNQWYISSGKRIMDIAVSALAISVLLPLLLLIAGLCWVNLGAPVIFRQRRAGRFGEPFQVFKFRSMRDAWHEDGTSLPDDVRLTRFGRFLRSSSLDELPSLFNVLQGTMSLVGPRPLLVEYVNRYTAEQLGRLSVRPGITGLAQVHGRQALRFSERILFDLEYVQNLSFRLDVSILLQTIPAVLGSRGVINGQLPVEVDDLAPPRAPEITVALISTLRGRFP